MALVRILLMRGDKGAGDQIQALRARFPAASPVHSAAGALALANNDLASATPSFQRALQLNPRSFEAVSGLVAIDLANKRFTEAKARVQALLTPPPTSATPLMLAATVYGIAGEADTTEKLLRQALDVEPSNPEVYGRLGELFVAQGRLDDARKEFNELSRLQPRSVGALSISGLLAYMQHDNAEARQRWEQALKVDSTAAAAANNLAWLYAETGGNLDIALQLAQTAKAQFSDSAEVDDTIGWIQLKRGLTALAVNYLERSAEKVPGNPSFQYHLGMAYAKQGEDGKARQALQRALAVSTDFDGAADARKTLATLVY
jgi:Flp pilus assembly protein TadD